MQQQDKLVIAYDLGTGGLKSSVFTAEGEIIASTFEPYATHYPTLNQQEQAPEDWWTAIVASTKRLTSREDIDSERIVALAISGHSLGVVPIGKDGSLLRDKTPIWSDARATQQVDRFFEGVDYEKWYTATGAGFPASCYSIFKIMWYRENEPEIYSQIDKVIGTKDYCNYRFTGRLCTDYSYASGSGAYDLLGWDYRDDYIAAAGLDKEIFPEILASDAIVGYLTAEAAEATGLSQSVAVISGGVDNSCMALGAKGIAESRVYTSLGSSAWIAIVSSQPIVDFKRKPYVFAHLIKGMYASATCIFSAGSSLQWVRNVLCCDLVEAQNNGGEDAYNVISRLVSTSPIGANGVLFNPSLAGGSMLEPTPFMQGAFTGLKLSNSREDILRATMEGIALNLRIALDVFKKFYPNIDEMLMVGGGAKSPVWMDIFANCYAMTIEKSNIDQEAASLGAAAVALKGVGLWDDYSKIDTIHKCESKYEKSAEAVAQYDKVLERFKSLSTSIAELTFIEQ
ncbi:MAG: FGGY-family carbohydrate kinase [Rikenellaceae bacterium]